MYITNISHIIQNDKRNFFDKTKTIVPKTWSISLTKKSLMTYQKLVFTVNRTHT